MVPCKLAPSILTADFAWLGEQTDAAELAGVEYIHVDVMDGHFVPNITIGPLLVETLKRVTRLPLHLLQSLLSVSVLVAQGVFLYRSSWCTPVEQEPAWVFLFCASRT